MPHYLSKTPYQAPALQTLRDWHCAGPQLTEEAYAAFLEQTKAARGSDLSDIVYESDGLKVTGVEALPTLEPNEKVPLIIYNRGGSGNFGMLTPFQINSMITPYAQRMRAGVLASNYRGNAGGEGQEEWGGRDVQDVLNLMEIGKSQPWWDGKNIFMMGWSRGCMMSYLALKQGAQVNAVVSGAGGGDLFALSERRPDMEKVYQRFIPDYATDREQQLKARSVNFWPEKINVPVLMLHGDADDRVDVSESRNLYAQLHALGKPVKYVEFPGGNHGLSAHQAQVVDETVRWFEQYRVRDVAIAP